MKFADPEPRAPSVVMALCWACRRWFPKPETVMRRDVRYCHLCDPEAA